MTSRWSDGADARWRWIAPSSSASFCSIAGCPAGYIPVSRRRLTKPLSSATGSTAGLSEACAIVEAMRSSPLCERRARLASHARERRIPDAIPERLKRFENGCAVHVLTRCVIDESGGGLRLLDDEVVARQERDHLTVRFRLGKVPERLLRRGDNPSAAS